MDNEKRIGLRCPYCMEIFREPDYGYFGQYKAQPHGSPYVCIERLSLNFRDMKWEIEELEKRIQELEYKS